MKSRRIVGYNVSPMKNLLSYFTLLILAMSTSAQDKMTFGAGYGLCDQENLKLLYTGQNIGRQTGSDWDIATLSVISQNQTFYLSSNPLVLLLALVPLEIGHANPLLVPQLLTNFRLTLTASENHLFLYAGQSTDYFFFYGRPRVYTETLAGCKLVLGDFEILADIRKPWTDGFKDNKDAYFNLGLALAFWEPSSRSR